jgi:hypothetical protein
MTLTSSSSAASTAAGPTVHLVCKRLAQHMGDSMGMKVYLQAPSTPHFPMAILMGQMPILLPQGMRLDGQLICWEDSKNPFSWHAHQSLIQGNSYQQEGQQHTWRCMYKGSQAVVDKTPVALCKHTYHVMLHVFPQSIPDACP